jgi:hypothetical protein
MFDNQNNVHYNKSMRLYNRKGISSPLSYDSKLVECGKRLRREIEEIKRRMSLYNAPISTDNFL